MTQSCIFCQIATGRAAAERLLETDRVMAFLDIAPVHYGHALVIPKQHFETFLGMNNFPAAGQVVFHAHLHVIPRYIDDGLHLFPQGAYQGQDMASVGRQLREALVSL
jgi:histidine triad (HIT) family protein